MLRYAVFASFFLISLVADAQFTRYVIELTDKQGTLYSPANPSGFLSQRAIERRARQKISIDSTDLPLSAIYLERIRTVPNLLVLNQSKWLNTVCIQTADANALATLNSFLFVKKVSAVSARAQAEINRVPAETVHFLSRLSNSSSVNANSINYGNSLGQIHIHNGEFLHNMGFAGEGIVIAILDAGFSGYKTNPAIDSVRHQNRILGEWDFVENHVSVNEDDSHGFFCFSIIAANRPGLMVGSAPKASFYLYRTEDARSEYPVEEQNWAAAAELADSLGVDMISSSLGYSDFDNHDFDHTYAERNGNTTVVTRAADMAAKKGMIVMNSAGNSGNETGDMKFVECPADGDSVVAVGAVNVNGVIAGFSSWGPNGAGRRKPNIVSVGQATTITGLDGNPASGNGTSYANPNIAGLIACFWQAFPELTNMEVIDAVQKSAHKFSTPDDRYGYGIPDFKKAFTSLLLKQFTGSLTNQHCATTVAWTGKDNQGMRYDIERKTGSDTGYTRLASFTGKSAAFKQNSYSFTDTLKLLSPLAARYRIRQFLADTSVILFDSVVNITESCLPGNSIVVSPSPFSGTIRITLNSPEAIENLGIVLYNMQGQKLYQLESSKATGISTFSIPATRLPPGVYVLTIRNNGRRMFSQTIIK